ncbi:ATP-binding protein [Nesterenkonia sp. AY15]|uniref:sensor histidine kinase n=1 Tax=unclassified Nesterenkonia TaxID=2629769 RepID=UPI001F4C85A3|nr:MULTISPECIES: ATP-binding protein [unclassified Nesterenkonia]MCH8563630.1 ATP-binding protein [Nesterenkonia sp. YGD6]MCH8570843.1 ATP-binding protein [Nesterenkonia sp. AY15]
MIGQRRFTGLGTRILAALILVLGVAVVTAWVVALIVGPAIFDDHMEMVETSNPDPGIVAHAEEAFDAAWRLSLLLALLTAFGTSVVVTVILVRRLVRPIRKIRSAVVEITDGDYSARVPESSIGAEFTELMVAFNSMAAELDRTELTRKRLLSDLAHEMRTPVSTVDGYLEAMQDGIAHADDETLVMLREQTERLTRLAEDISLVSAAEEGCLDLRLAPVQLGELLDAASAQIRARYQAAGVNLEIKIGNRARAVTITADRDRIGQVLTNLLDNALHHTERGDEVTLSARASRSHVTVDVVDTGHGIDPAHLAHLFERFYRVDSARDRTHGGSGIGLAIVRSIVTAHGGSVWAFSEGTGKGAVFTVELPQGTQDLMKVP